MREKSRDYAFLGLILISAVALSIAYSAHYIFHVLPCPLCIWQRYLYMIILGIGVLFYKVKGLNPQHGLIWASLFIILNMGVATYQTFVEKKLISAPAFCQKRGGQASDLEQLKKELAQSQELVPCDEVTFSFYGVSIALLNAAFCFVLGSLLLGLYFYHRLYSPPLSSSVRPPLKNSLKKTGPRL